MKRSRIAATIWVFLGSMFVPLLIGCGRSAGVILLCLTLIGESSWAQVTPSTTPSSEEATARPPIAGDPGPQDGKPAEQSAAENNSAATSVWLQSVWGPGIQFPNDQVIMIPSPVVKIDQTINQRLAAAKPLAQPHAWSRFSRDSIYAPVSIDLEYLRDSLNNRIGHSVRLAFIAYSPLESLSDADAIKSLFGANWGQVDGDERSAKLPENADNGSVGFESTGQLKRMEFELLNKVLVQGVAQVHSRAGPNWLQLAWRLTDEPLASKFGSPVESGTGMPQPPSRLKSSWQVKTRNELGKVELSAPQPYQGMGGYVSIAELNSNTDQWLVELRLVMHEPPQWFSGSNFLRSKLPLMMQELARKFRREMQSDSSND